MLELLLLAPVAWRRNLRLVAGLLVVLAIVGRNGAAADGAIAIGLPADVAKQGLAVGTSWNYASSEAARARALEECLSFMDAPPDTRKLCKVVRTFTRECVAVAIDPKDGTPGYGWAVEATKNKAEDMAMRNCISTAGRDRQKFCKVSTTRCDGQ